MVDDGELPVAGGSDRTAIPAAWIGAGAAIVAAVIGAIATFLAAGGGGTGDSASGQTASQSPARTPIATEPSPTMGTGRWSGTLVLGPLGAGDKDLDVYPPAHATTDADNDLYITLPSSPALYALGDAYVATWQTPGTPPTAADCLNTVASANADGVPLTQGAVICARTGEGRIVRLTLTAPPSNGTATATFDAVVWQTV